MNKVKRRYLSALLAVLLIFTSFSPSITKASEPISWSIQYPEGYTQTNGGTVRIYNQKTGNRFYGYVSGSSVIFYGGFQLDDSTTYSLETAIHFMKSDSSDGIFYYDYQNLSGADLKNKSTLIISDQAKLLNVNKDSIPVENYQLNVVSKYIEWDGFASGYGANMSSKILTSSDSLSLFVTGNDDQNQTYLVNKSIDTVTTSEIDFSADFTNLVPLTFQSNTDQTEISNLQLKSKEYHSSAWISIYNTTNTNLNNLFVTPGQYNINVNATAAIPGGLFRAWWEKKDVNVTSPVTLPIPGIPQSLNDSRLNWYIGNHGQLTVGYYSEGFRLNGINDSGPLTTRIDILDQHDTVISTENYPNVSHYFNITVPERFSGFGKIRLSLLNGDEVIASKDHSFELQDQSDTSINGVVVTANDQAGNPLSSADVYVMERVNHASYFENDQGYDYYLNQVYRTNLKDHEGVPEAFIPNAYLLAGREYELVVKGVTAEDETIIYHKSLTAENLSTIHFDGSELHEIVVDTDKPYDRGYFGLSAVDTEAKNIASWPIMIDANEKVYVQSDFDLLLNAQLINQQSDVGYFYSEWIELGTNKTHNIHLDSLDTNMVQVGAPTQYEKAKIGVGSFWYTGDKVSTFYISKHLYELDFGVGITLSLSVTSNGYQYDFNKYIHDLNQTVNLDVTGPFNGWMNQYLLDPATKKASFFTNYLNNNGMFLLSVAPVQTQTELTDDNQAYFRVVDSTGDQKVIQTSANEGYTETHQPFGATEGNLLNYQIFQGNQTVGDVISSSDVSDVSFTLPAEEGAYQLKLANQLFPTDVVTLAFDQGFNVYNNVNQKKQFSISYSNNEYELYPYLDVRLMEIEEHEGTPYISNYLYLGKNKEGRFETYQPIKPDGVYYITIRGEVNKGNKPYNIIDYKKMTGNELLNMSEYVIDHQQLIPISLSNDTGTITDDPRYQMLLTLEGQIKTIMYLSSFNEKADAFVKQGTYEPILAGVTVIDAYSYKYPEMEITSSRSIRLTPMPTVEVNLVKAGQEVPFKSFGVRYSNTIFMNGYDFSYTKKVLRKLHVTPGVTDIRFSLIQIEDNETPWRYDYMTGDRDFTTNTSLTISDDYVADVKYFENWKYEDGTSIISAYSQFKAGDLYLQRVAVGREYDQNGMGMNILTQPIREYEGEFDYFVDTTATIKITNAENKVVYKEDRQWSLGFVSIQKNLPPGKYTLSYQLPVGPNKTAGFTRVFDVTNEDTPFVTLLSPENLSATNNRTVTISGETNPDATVTLKVFQAGTETVVDEKIVTADSDGSFSAPFTLNADGQYDVKGYVSGDDTVVSSNSLTFTIDTTAPVKPSNVKVEQLANNLYVTWDQIEDANSYKVEVAVGNGAFTTVAEGLRTNQYTYTNVLPATTYHFKITAMDAVGNTSVASDSTSFLTASFVATKLELLGEVNSYNLFKLGQELTVQLEGSYEEGYTGQAIVTYLSDTQEATERLELDYNAEKKVYQGTFAITPGVTKIVKVEGWIASAQAAETDKLSKNVNISVGASIEGKVFEAGLALTKKARVRLIGKNIIDVDTNDVGKFVAEGIPQGDYSVNVVFPLVGGKTFYNVTNGKLTLLNGHKTDLQNDINLPAYRDIMLKFVEKGTQQTPTKNLNVQISNAAGFVEYGYINKDGYFSSWSNVLGLKGIETGEYQVTIFKDGLYKASTQTITISPEQDYIQNPLVVDVEKVTAEFSELTLQFTNQELTNIDSISLFSWKVYQNFGYSGIGNYFYSYQDLQDGKLVIPDVVYSDDYQLYVNENGYRQFTKSPVNVNASAQTLEVTLDQGLTLTGKVVDSKGDVITTGQVHAYSNSSYASVAVNADGTFELKGLASDENIKIEVSSAEYVSYQRTYASTEVATGQIGDIVLKKASFVHGKVVDKNNQPLKYVYVNAYEPLDSAAEGSKEVGTYKGWARTGSDGYFKINGLAEGEYDLRITNYILPDLVERKKETAKDGYIFILQEDGEGSFAGEGNRLSASKQTVVPGKTIQYRLNYQNNGTADVENVPLKVNLPANVTVMEESVQLNGKEVAWNNGTVEVDKVVKGEKGVLTFEVEVQDSQEAMVQVTATINDAPEKQAEVLSAVTNVLFVTLHAPATTAQKKIKVYGNAKTGSDVEIYANGNMLTKVKVDGRWWFAEVTLPVKDLTKDENFTLNAKVIDGTDVVMAEKVNINYSPSIPQIEDVSVFAGWNGTVKLNPYTGLATFAVVEKTPLNTNVTFNEEIDSASISFLGETYPMNSTNKKDFTFDGRLLGEWSSYGEQLLELTYTKDDIKITIPLMEIIVLIDPSGYVFEGSMASPLAGVTAVVEQLVDGQWVRWNAELFGQINPQTTDENGRYGWDVSKGDWRVIFTKDGYEPYISRIVQVPPLETQLNVPLVRKGDPTVASISPADKNNLEVNANLVVNFDRLMSTTDKEAFIKLYKINGTNRTEVQGTVQAVEVNGYKEKEGAVGFFEEDTTQKLAKSFTFVPATNLEAGATYELEVSESFTDYGGKTLGEKVTERFTTKTAQTPPPVDNGGGNSGTPVPVIPTPVTPTPVTPIPVPPTPVPPAPPSTPQFEVKDGVLTLDEKLLTIDGHKGTLTEATVLTAISKSTTFDTLIIQGGEKVTDFAFTSKLLLAMKAKNNKARVIFENELGSFTLPVTALKVDELASKLGSDTLQFIVSVAKSEDTFLGKGVAVKSAPVEFKLSVIGNGQAEQVEHFDTFVERTMFLAEDVNVTKATAVKVTGAGFVSAPTVFKGKVATIKSRSLGTYVIVQAERSFADVDHGKNWAESYIETLASKFIINGKTETTFAPSDKMTRGQFAALISRSLGLTASGEYKGQLKDITDKDSEIIAAFEAGIITGKPDGTFAPNATITRTQAAVMIARAMKYVGYDRSKLDSSKVVKDFKDASSIQSWATADVEMVVQAGIMNGTKDGLFKPNDNTKRDQMAKMLAEFLVFVGLMNK